MLKAQLKTLILLSALTLSLGLPAAAQSDFPELNQVYQSFKVDLDKDGSPETIEVKAVAVDEESYTGRLIVKNAKGTLLWQGPVFMPKEGFVDSSLFLGSWPVGSSQVNLLQDLDSNGVVDLLATSPQSDVRPSTWRVFSWTGKAFAYVAKGNLVESEPESGKFNFIETDSADESWVQSIQREGKDLIGIIYVIQGESEAKIGRAKMKLNNNGMEVLEWLEAPQTQPSD
jgi:hypothetical protein